MSDDQQQIKGFTFVQGFDRQFEKVRDNPDLTLKFLNALRDYWFRGVEPSFDDPRDGMIWEGIGDLLVRTRQNRQIRSTAQLGNQNARKPSKTKENETKRPETKENDEKRTKTNENETKQENRIEEESKVEERKVEESKVISPYKTAPVEKKSPNRRPETATVNGETTRRSHKTTAKTVAELMALYPDAMPFWKRIQTPYPSFRCHTPGEGTLQFIEKERLWEKEAEIISAINNFNANDANWQAGRVWRLSKFIEERHWEHEPAKPIVETVRKIYTNQAPMPKYTDNSDIPQF